MNRFFTQLPVIITQFSLALIKALTDQLRWLGSIYYHIETALLGTLADISLTIHSFRYLFLLVLIGGALGYFGLWWFLAGYILVILIAAVQFFQSAHSGSPDPDVERELKEQRNKFIAFLRIPLRCLAMIVSMLLSLYFVGLEQDRKEQAIIDAQINITLRNDSCWNQDFYANDKLVASVSGYSSVNFRISPGTYATKSCASRTSNCGTTGNTVWTKPVTHILLQSSDCIKEQSKTKERPPTKPEPVTEASNCIEGNCFNGYGTETYPDGSKYIGQFKNGLSEGRGTLILSNGEKRIGNFKNDQFISPEPISVEQPSQPETPASTAQQLESEPSIETDKYKTWTGDWGNGIIATVSSQHCENTELINQGYNYLMSVTIPIVRLKNPDDAWQILGDKAVTITGCWSERYSNMIHAKLTRKKGSKTWEQDFKLDDGKWTSNSGLSTEERVIEGLKLAATAKTAVAENIANNKPFNEGWIAPNATVNVSTKEIPTNDDLATNTNTGISINPVNGIITITYTDKIAKNSPTILLIPNISENGDLPVVGESPKSGLIQWECHSATAPASNKLTTLVGTINPKYVPANCRR